MIHFIFSMFLSYNLNCLNMLLFTHSLKSYWDYMKYSRPHLYFYVKLLFFSCASILILTMNNTLLLQLSVSWAALPLLLCSCYMDLVWNEPYWHGGMHNEFKNVWFVFWLHLFCNTSLPPIGPETLLLPISASVPALHDRCSHWEQFPISFVHAGFIASIVCPCLYYQ